MWWALLGQGGRVLMVLQNNAVVGDGEYNARRQPTGTACGRIGSSRSLTATGRQAPLQAGSISLNWKNNVEEVKNVGRMCNLAAC